MIFPKCKCGCNRKITWNIKKRSWNIFLKGHYHKKYQFNRNKFKTIKTREDAYWLGFFFADGFVKNKKGKGSFGFHLAIKDLDHLKKFRLFMESTSPIIIDNRFCRLEINDRSYCDFLSYKYGLIQGKSAYLLMPKLPNRLICHFIRGVFDGDGWVGYSKKRKSYYFGIVGCKSFLSEIQQILVARSGLNLTKLRRDLRCKSKWTVTMSYGGNRNALKFYTFVYKKCNIFLARKFNIWKLYLKI